MNTSFECNYCVYSCKLLGQQLLVKMSVCENFTEVIKRFKDLDMSM